MLIHQRRRQWGGQGSLPPQGAWSPGRLRRLEFDARYVPPKTLFGPILAWLWRRRCYSRPGIGGLEFVTLNGEKY